MIILLVHHLKCSCNSEGDWGGRETDEERTQRLEQCAHTNTCYKIEHTLCAYITGDHYFIKFYAHIFMSILQFSCECNPKLYSLKIVPLRHRSDTNTHSKETFIKKTILCSLAYIIWCYRTTIQPQCKKLSVDIAVGLH